MSSIPDDIRRFVLGSIPSVPHLEAALLFRAQPGLERSSPDVARALYVPEHTAARLLQDLCAAGMLQPAQDKPLTYRYGPKDEALAHTLDRLADVYRLQLIEVTNLIHDSTQRHAVRFAEAFKLGKKGS